MEALGRVWAEINLDALVDNFRSVKRQVGNKKIMLAIKADAYGHGAREVAKCLVKEGLDMVGVASVAEGIDLRTDGGLTIPILVLSPTPYDEILDVFNYHLTPTITELDFARLVAATAEERRCRLKVQVEVDTGMGRTGFAYADALGAILEIAQNPALELEGIFTHFPAADSDLEFTRNQITDFNRLLTRLAQAGVTPPLKHAANSSGFLNFPESHFDMVRPGLTVYGIYPNHSLQPKIDLRPVMSLKTRVVNLQRLARGQSVSYGRSFRLERDSQIAVLSCGYGDGYPRLLSNRGEVLLRGKRAPIVGAVCMDLTMVDVTDHPVVNIGDEVLLMGDGISVHEVAAWAETIPYEIICLISPRVPRVYLHNGKRETIRTLLTL